MIKRGWSDTFRIIAKQSNEDGVCSAWGTLVAGIFNIGGTSLSIIGVQLLGIVSCFAWTFTVAFTMFKIISSTIGLRVSAEEEIEGLDHTEHGGVAYLGYLPMAVVCPQERVMDRGQQLRPHQLNWRNSCNNSNEKEDQKENSLKERLKNFDKAKTLHNIYGERM